MERDCWERYGYQGHSKLPLKNLNPYVHTLNYSHHNIKYCFSKSARNIKQLHILYTSRV